MAPPPGFQGRRSPKASIADCVSCDSPRRPFADTSGHPFLVIHVLTENLGPGHGAIGVLKHRRGRLLRSY
jgi:hypothetical protein